MRKSSAVEKTTLIGIGLIIAVFAAQGLKLIGVTWRAVFPLVVLLIILSSLFWWSWVNRQLRQGVSPERQSKARWLRGLWAAYVVAMFSPVAMIMAGGHHTWDSFPVFLITWILIWHMLMVLIGTASTGVSAVRRLWQAVRRHRPVAMPADDPPGLSRRDLLRSAAAVAPLVITGAAVARGTQQAGQFNIRKVDVRLPRLPDRLRGLTVTQISDMHVGRLFRPDHLPRMVDAANKLNSDLLVVTGDMIDHSIDFLAPACEALRQIETRCGRFMVIGNHDLMRSGEEVVDYLRRREPYFLEDRTVPLLIGGETIQITGLFWSRYDEPRGGRDPGHVGRVKVALDGVDMKRFTLALAHHPHAFDPLAARGVDLTISGHTHGGQLMLTPPGCPWPIGGGSLLFRYIWGEYRRGESILQVSSGIGNWFPVRINAPAEMVQYRLV